MIGRPAIDMTGFRTGRLVVVGRAENTKDHKAQWFCKCDCGRKTVVSRRNLLGATTSCGCLARERSSERRRMAYRPPMDRAMELVDKSGNCWIYAGAKDRNGYGLIRGRDGNKYVHRLTYENLVGPIGENCVLHKCDVPACCNPDHLFLGDRQLNNADKVAKGRHRFGERVVGAKLTESAVREIRSLAGQVTQRELASRYGISGAVVSEVIARKRWRHVI